jgi:hypothetical protein
MSYRYWEEVDSKTGVVQRHAVVGRLRADSPAKHGDLDWRWYFPPSEEEIAPTMPEALALAPGIAIAQEAIFAPPPESVIGLRTNMRQAIELETAREVVQAAQILHLHWKRHELERAYARQQR